MSKLIPAAATAVGAFFGGPAGAMIGSAVGSAIGGSRSQSATPVELPKVAPPTVMATADSQIVAAAKKRSIIEQVNGRGRASTILTDTASSDKLGG